MIFGTESNQSKSNVSFTELTDTKHESWLKSSPAEMTLRITRTIEDDFLTSTNSLFDHSSYFTFRTDHQVITAKITGLMSE